MSPGTKRKLSTAARTVSPPATRRRASPQASPQASPSRTHGGTSSSFNPSRLTIVSWNVNGIGLLLQNPLSFNGPADTPLRAFLRRHNWPALLCLQEVKIPPSDLSSQRHVQSAANTGTQHDSIDPENPGYSVTLSLPRDKYNATGFGGKVHGVATLVRRDVTTHGINLELYGGSYDGVDRRVLQTATRSVDWDLEGRVLVTQLTDNRLGKYLAVVNGYWVNGTSNPYCDPNTGTVTGTRHDHKLRFHKHMFEHCHKLEAEGYEVVLIGDMNVAPQWIDGYPNLRTSPMQHVKNRADFNEKFLADGGWGVDVFRAMHGSKKQYTYHPRRGVWGESCDRVDLVVAGKALIKLGAVTACGIEDSAKERGHSDHVPLWVTIDVSKLTARLQDGNETEGKEEKDGERERMQQLRRRAVQPADG